MVTQNYFSLLTVWLLQLLPGLTRGQEPFVSGLAPYFSWGAFNKSEVDAFCFSGNTASLARCRQLAAGLTGERPYGIAALARYRFAGIIPVNNMTLGIQGGFVSSPPYRELMLSIGAGRKLRQSIDIGVGFGYTRTAVPSYPAQSYAFATAGMIMHLTGQVSAGWQVTIPRQLGDRSMAGPPRPRYSMGIGFNPSATWSAAIEVGRGPASGIGAGAGFIYRPHRLVIIKMGFTTAGPPLWFGMGYQLKKFRFDLSASVHDRLGFSPAMGLLQTNLPSP